MARDSHMRGTLKDNLIPLVRETFGFRNTSTPKAIIHNRKLYDVLKTNNSLVFKVSTDTFLFPTSFLSQRQDFRNRKGLYESPLIQQALNAMWFPNPAANGIKFAAYFNPIPIKTIALIYTAVCNSSSRQ